MSTDLEGQREGGVEHGQDHEEFLIELLADPSAAETDAARARLVQCAECRSRLIELRAFADRVESLEDERRTVIAASRQGPRDAEFARRLEALRSQSDRNRRVRWVPRWVLFAAAVLLASLAAYLYERNARRPVPSHGEEMLSTDYARIETPKGPDQSFDVFRWQYLLSAGSHCEVFVDVVDEHGRVTNTIRGRTSTNAWNPTRAEIEAMGRSIRWRVDIVDATGDVRSLPEVSASR